MFKTLLATVGVGAAKVDLVLDQDRITQGGKVTGRILLSGGSVKQTIQGLSVDFRVWSVIGEGYKIKEKVCTIPVTDETFEIEPGEERTYPFSFICPENLPYSHTPEKNVWGNPVNSRGTNTKFYFQTNLDIHRGKDAKDRDYIDVFPKGLAANFLEGCWMLGFRLRGESYFGQKEGVQGLYFVPGSWVRGKFDEIKFALNLRDTREKLHFYFEIDRATHGMGLKGALADVFDKDEKRGSFSFTAEELETPEKAKETIRNFILKQSEGIVGI